MDTKVNQKKVALALIRWGESYSLLYHLEQFTKLDQKRVVKKLLENDDAMHVWELINKFDRLSKRWITDRMIQSGRHLRTLVMSLDNFNEDEINEPLLIRKLLNQEKWNLIIENLEKFKELNHQVLLNKMFKKQRCISERLIKTLFENIDKFNNIDYERLVRDIVEAKRFYQMMEYFDKIKGKINHERFIELLLKPNNYMTDVARYADRFEGIDYQKLADRLSSKARTIADMASNVGKFKWIDQKKLAEQLIEYGYQRHLRAKKKYFTNLDEKRLKWVLRKNKAELKWAYRELGVNISDLKFDY